MPDQDEHFIADSVKVPGTGAEVAIQIMPDTQAKRPIVDPQPNAGGSLLFSVFVRTWLAQLGVSACRQLDQKGARSTFLLGRLDRWPSFSCQESAGGRWRRTTTTARSSKNHDHQRKGCQGVGGTKGQRATHVPATDVLE